MTIQDLKKKKLKIFDHPYLKEPCFKLGLEQKEYLKTCEVFKSFQNQLPIINKDFNEMVEVKILE